MCSERNSVAVARYVVAYARKNGYSINMTKLQKLLYILYGTYLAISGKRLVNERPQAWPYGPVFPITRERLLNEDFYSIEYSAEEFSEIKKDDDITSLMNSVFGFFGSWTASRLTQWSHSEGTPWELTTSEPGFKWGKVIPDDRIQAYFKSIIIPHA